MARKRKKTEEHVDESWLVPYADVLTLLLALFIVLFAMSAIDANKFKQLSLSLNEEFDGGTGNEQFLAELEASTEKELAEQEAELSAFIEERAQELIETQKAEAIKSELENLREVQKIIDQYIEENNLKLSLKTSLTEHGLMITILDNVLFDSGSAELRENSIYLVDEISNLIVAAMPRQVLISGHTDNVPIHNEEYKSNWELSTQRSVNFLEKMLTSSAKLKPENFSAIGYGEHRPVAENTTSEGRQKNRRVEVLILPLTNSSNNDVTIHPTTDS